MGKLFGTDGIRGIANTELTCELAFTVGKALVAVLKKADKDRSTFVIGCDTRRSSDMLSAAVISGACSAGADTVFIGCAPTPAVAYLTKTHAFDAGIMISASHNPAEYNGIKIFGTDGIKLPDQLEDEIEKIIAERSPLPSPDGLGIGKALFHAEDYLSEYIEYLKKTVSHRLDGLNIAVDCANGSTAFIAEKLFSQLGATVYALSSSPNGDNINENCGSTHLENLKAYMRTHRPDLGFAFDGDGDRCMCVDSDGNEIDGDRIMAICALDMKRNGKLNNNAVVGTVMTNLGFTRFCQDNGIKFVATKVGDRFVSEEMRRGDFALGGEQSGHIIFREHSTTGDGLLTALQLLSIIKNSGRTAQELSSVMKVYPQITVNLHANESSKARLLSDPDIKKAIKTASDLLSPNGRLLVRPSGTEPLIRIMAEGIDEQFISEIANDLASQLRSALK